MARPTKPILLHAEVTERGCLLHLLVPDDLYYLEGHFPQTPVVAGICQLKWVVEAIEACCGERVHVVAMEMVKFHRILAPGQQCFMEVNFNQQANAWNYRMFWQDKKFASGRLVVEV